jgi:phage shock protein C
MTDDAGRSPRQVPPHATNRLLRSADDRMIAGVCGGLAAYLGVDAAIVRVAAVVLALTGGAAIIAYVVAWAIIPEARPGELTPVRTGAVHPQTVRFIAGAALIAIGGLWLLGGVVPGLLVSRVVWPIVLVAVGVFLLVRGTNR